jgi:hypothetical protein
MPWPQILTSRVGMFVWGAATAPVLQAAAPIVGNVVRPFAREAIKAGILLGRAVRTIVDDVREGLEDITAEAQAELEAEQSDLASRKNGNGAV